MGNPDGSARRGYAALCEHVDVWLGRFLDELAAEPAADVAELSGANTAAAAGVPGAASNVSTNSIVVDAVHNSSASDVSLEEQQRRLNRPFTPEAVAAAREAALGIKRSVLDVTLVLSGTPLFLDRSAVCSMYSTSML